MYDDVAPSAMMFVDFFSRSAILSGLCESADPLEFHCLMSLFDCACYRNLHATLSYVNDISVALISDTDAFWCECLACTGRVYERLRGSPQNGTFIFSPHGALDVIVCLHSS